MTETPKPAVTFGDLFEALSDTLDTADRLWGQRADEFPPFAALRELRARVIEQIAEAADDAPLPDSQWMKITALLLHRFALKGETVVISAAEMQRLNENYPDGADLRAEDGEDGSIELTLLPPDERPTGIIMPQHGPGRVLS